MNDLGSRPVTRRKFLGATAATIGSLTLTACGLGTNSGLTGASAGMRRGPVQVTYWHMWTSDWKKLIDSIVDEFNKAQSDVHVNPLSVTGDPNAKFLTARAGGDPPDLMTQWNMVLASWAEMGALANLDNFKDAEGIRKWMYPIVAKIGIYKENMYAVPFSMNTFMLYYNKELFEQEGLDPEKTPKTIEELDQTQSKMWKIDNRGFIQRMGFIPGGLTQWSTAFDGQWANKEGEPTATYTNNLKTLQWFDTYAHKYDPSKVNAFNQSLNSNINSAWPFLSNRQAFALDGMWRLVDLQKYAPNLKYGIFPLPYPRGYGKPNACLVNGNYEIIPTGAKHPQEAWEFTKWLSGYGSESRLAELLPKGGWIPVSPKITEEKAYQKFMDEIPARRKYVELLTSPNVQIAPNIPVLQYYWDRAASAEEAVMNRKMTPNQALNKLQTEVERELSRTIVR